MAYSWPEKMHLPSLLQAMKPKLAREGPIVASILRQTILSPGWYQLDEEAKEIELFSSAILSFTFLYSPNNRAPRKMTSCGDGGGFLGMVGSLAQEFLKQKLENDEGYAQTAADTEVGDKHEAYAGATKRALPDSGILISGCQTDQTSADASPSGNAAEAYGALSNAIQTILAESDGDISNRELVLKASKKLKSQGFSQRPGLYCSDDHADASFVC